MRKAALIIFTCAVITSCHPEHRNSSVNSNRQVNNNVWTTSYERSAYKEIYDQTSYYSPDTNERKRYTAYLIKIFKAKMPEGINSISADSLKNVILEVSKNYPQKGQSHDRIAWSQVNEEMFRAAAISEVSKKIKDKAAQNKFCDCIIAQLKKHDPDSLITPVPQSLMTKMAHICLPKQ